MNPQPRPSTRKNRPGKGNCRHQPDVPATITAPPESGDEETSPLILLPNAPEMAAVVAGARKSETLSPWL